MFKKNLIYFLCPFKSNNEWLLNVRELKKYIHVFNGKKIVTVTQGPEFISLSKIKQEFEDMDIYFYTMPNDNVLGEVNPFKKMLTKVESLNPCEITFYAHAKGVSPKYQNRTNRIHMKNIRIWRNVMYHYCLRDIGFIESILSDFSCCGCFKRDRPGLGIRSSQWHFAGTYFWFNNNKLFSKNDWANVDGDRWAVEGYLGDKFNSKESFCLFGDNRFSYEPIKMTKEEWDFILPNKLTHIDFKYGLIKN